MDLSRLFTFMAMSIVRASGMQFRACALQYMDILLLKTKQKSSAGQRKCPLVEIYVYEISNPIIKGHVPQGFVFHLGIEP